MPTNNQKLDFIFKKTLNKGDTLTDRDYYTERGGKKSIRPEEVWVEVVPSSLPEPLDFNTGNHLDVDGNLQLLKNVRVDFIPGSDFTYRHNADLSLLLDIVPNYYGDGSYNYLIKDADGVKVDFGVGDWILDLETGQLRFYDPTNQFFTALNSEFLTITCVKYIGDKLTEGVGTPGGGDSLCSNLVDPGINVLPNCEFIQSNSNLQTSVGILNVKDEDLETQWIATLTNNVWIRIDFGSANPITLRRFKIYADPNRMGDFSIYGSNLPDPLYSPNLNNSWDNLGNYNYINNSRNELAGFLVDNNTPYRWYLIHIHESSDPNTYPIGAKEIKFYETIDKTNVGHVIDETNERCKNVRLALYEDLLKHVNEENPHNITAEKISVPTLSDFLEHINDDSKHVWDKDRIGLSLIENILYVPQSDVGKFDEDYNGVAPLDANNKIPNVYLPQISAGLSFLGTWNALTNQPQLADNGEILNQPEPPAGSYYVVSNSSETRTIDGEMGWNSGDWIIKGSNGWFKIENAGTVFSVNNRTGVVTLETDEIPEGTENLYYTNQRVLDLLNNQGLIQKIHIQNTDTRLKIDPLDDVPLLPTDPIVPDFISGENYLSANKILWHIQNEVLHAPLDDGNTSSSSLWSSQKIINYINSSPQLHTHDNKGELDKIQDGDHERRLDNPHEITKEQIGLGNLENVLYVKVSDVGKYGETFNGVAPLNSNNKIPLGYLQLSGGLKFKGLWDPTTNTPELASGGMGEPGAYYVIKNTGNSPDPIDGLQSFEQGDWIVDSDGYWDVIDGSGIVISVNGKDGAVELTTQDIPEDIDVPELDRNRYFTDLRVSNSPDVALNTALRHGQNTDWYLDIDNDNGVKTSASSLRDHLENQFNPLDDDGNITPRKNDEDPRKNATNPHDVQFTTLADTEPYYLSEEKSANDYLISLFSGGFNPVTESDYRRADQHYHTVTTPSGSIQVLRGFVAYRGIYAFNSKWNTGTTVIQGGGDFSYSWVTGSNGLQYPANEDEWLQIDFGAALAQSDEPEDLEKLGYFIPNMTTTFSNPDGDPYYQDMKGYVREVSSNIILQELGLKPYDINLIGFFDPRLDINFDFPEPKKGEIVLITRTWVRSSGVNPLLPVNGVDSFTVGDLFAYNGEDWELIQNIDSLESSFLAYFPDSKSKGYLAYFDLQYPEGQDPEDFEDPEDFKAYTQKIKNITYPGKLINAIKLAAPSVRDFSFYGSFDGKTWLRLLSDRHDGFYVHIPVTGGNLDILDGDPNNNFRVYTFNNNKHFRFYRLNVHNTYGGNAQVTRLELLENSHRGKVPVVSDDKLSIKYTNLPPSEAIFDHLVDLENPHQITTDKIGAVSKLEFKHLLKEFTVLEGDYVYHRDDLWNPHLENTDNPHEVTKVDVGLSEVDNVKQIPFTYIGLPGGVAPLSSVGSINAGRVPYEYLPLALDLRSNIVDNLESTRTDLALSANQGRYLLEIIEDFKGEGIRIVDNLDSMVQDAYSTSPNLNLKYWVKNDSENDNESSLFAVISEIPSAFNGEPTSLDIKNFWSEFGDPLVWEYNDGSDLDNIQYIHQIHTKKNKRELTGFHSDFNVENFTYEATLTCTRQEGGELGIFFGDFLNSGNINNNVISIVNTPDIISPEKIFDQQALAIEINEVIQDASNTDPSTFVGLNNGDKYFLVSTADFHTNWGSLNTDINGNPKPLSDNSIVQYVNGSWRILYNANDLDDLSLIQNSVSFRNSNLEYYEWDALNDTLVSWSIPNGGGLATAQEGHKYILTDVSNLAASWGNLDTDLNNSPVTITNNSIVKYQDDKWVVELLGSSLSALYLVLTSSGNLYNWNGTSFVEAQTDNITSRVRSFPIFQYEIKSFVSSPSTNSPNIIYREETEAIELIKVIEDASLEAPGFGLPIPNIGDKYFLKSVIGKHINWGSLNKDLFEDDITLTNNSYIQYTALGWRVIYNSVGLGSASIVNGGFLSFLDSTNNNIYIWDINLQSLVNWEEPLGGGLATAQEGDRYVLEDITSGLAKSWGVISKDINGNPATLDNNCIIEFLNGEWRVLDNASLIAELDSTFNYIIRDENLDYFQWDLVNSEFIPFSPSSEEELFEIVLNRGASNEEVLSSQVLRNTSTGWDSVFYKLQIKKTDDLITFKISSPNTLVFDNTKDFSVDLSSDNKFNNLRSTPKSVGLYAYQLLGAQVKDIKTVTYENVWNTATKVYFKPIRLRTDLNFSNDYKNSTSDSLGLSMEGANTLFLELDSTKVSYTDFNNHLTDFNNPHRVTQTDIGLGNVINKLQVTKSEVGKPDGVAPLNFNGKVSIAYLPVGVPNGFAPLNNESKIDHSWLYVNVEGGYPTLDSNLQLDSSYFIIDQIGGFITVQPDGYMKSSFINVDELPFPQLSHSTNKIIFDYLSINVPLGLLQLDTDAKVSLDQLHVGVPQGIATLDDATKVSLAYLHTGVPNGLATLDDATKVSLAYLHAAVPNGLATLDEATKVSLAYLHAAVPNGLATLDEDGYLNENQVPPYLLEGLKFRGFWSGGSDPDLEPSKDDYYIVDQNNSYVLNGFTDWMIGDWVIYLGEDEGWYKLDNNRGVLSVNGESGEVNLNTDDIPEGTTNFYYTDQKVLDIIDNLGTSHAQNTDQFLDEGGSFESSAEDIHNHIFDNVDSNVTPLAVFGDNPVLITEIDPETDEHNYAYDKPVNGNAHGLTALSLDATPIEDFAKHTFNFNNPHKTNFKDLNDLLFKNGDYDLTTGLTSSISASSENLNSEAFQAIDDDGTTYWYATSNDQEFIDFTFGLDSPHKVVSIQIDAGEFGLRNYTLYGSNNENAIGDITNSGIIGGVPDYNLWDEIENWNSDINGFVSQTHIVNNTEFYAHYRLYIHETVTNGPIGIQNLELKTEAEILKTLGFRFSDDFKYIIAGKNYSQAINSNNSGGGGSLPDLEDMQTIIGLDVGGGVSQTFPAQIIKFETPIEDVDGIENEFTIGNVNFIEGTLEVYVNGLLQFPLEDYELNSGKVILTDVPLANSKVWFNYWYKVIV